MVHNKIGGLKSRGMKRRRYGGLNQAFALLAPVLSL